MIVSISMDEDLHKEIEDKRGEVQRSAWIRGAIKDKLGKE